LESGVADGSNLISPNVVKALVNFKEFSDMRKVLCEVLSFTLLPDQIRGLRREFEKMDTDDSGEISLAAFKQILMTNAGAGSLGKLTEDEVTDIFDAMRVRKTETRIHWHEFIAAGLSQCSVDDRNLRLAFERLDSDHKGVRFECSWIEADTYCYQCSRTLELFATVHHLG
jgi:calcium-dependent protein kinase